MIKVDTTLHTDGKGHWTKVNKDIRIISYEVNISEWSELLVYFNKKDWSVRYNSFIYTDNLFKQELIEFLTEEGYDASDVEYSEQGAQDYNYVHFLVGDKFLESFVAKNEEYREAYDKYIKSV